MVPPNLITDIQIINSNSKLCVGLCIEHSLNNSRAKELWRQFMPRLTEIENRVTTSLLSIQIYNSNEYFENFNTDKPFNTWSAVEVIDLDCIPDGMQSIVIPKGNYATFIHKGGVDSFSDIFHYFYTSWLSQSQWILDSNRPHFEVLGDRFLGPDHPDSEEEIWIPVMDK